MKKLNVIFILLLLSLGATSITTASFPDWRSGNTKIGVYNSWHNSYTQWEARWAYARSYDLKNGIKFYHNSPYQVPGMAAIPANADIWDIADALYYEAGWDTWVYYYQDDMKLNVGDIVVSENSSGVLSWYTVESETAWRIIDGEPHPRRIVAFWTPRDASRKERGGVVPKATYVITDTPPEAVVYPTDADILVK